MVRARRRSRCIARVRGRDRGRVMAAPWGTLRRCKECKEWREWREWRGRIPVHRVREEAMDPIIRSIKVTTRGEREDPNLRSDRISDGSGSGLCHLDPI